MPKLLLLAPLLCGLLAAACDNRPDAVHARALEDAPGLRVTISGAGALPEDTVHALAKHLEGDAHDHEAAMVRIEKENGAQTVKIELWGGTLPQGDVSAGLKAQFPALAGATITSESLPAGQAPGPALPVIAVDDDLGPAEAEQQIRDQLAADGVDGDVDVKVVDGPEGRRIEVGVHKQEVH